MITHNLGGNNVRFLGDVHLGRVFKNGVPLHRRGEREDQIRLMFREALIEPGCDILVQVGDLFDKYRVDLNEVIFAADCIEEASRAFPNRQFIFLAGNHDLARDVDKVSSFDLTARLCESLINVKFVSGEPYQFGPLLCLPWSPVKSAAEIVEPITGKFAAVVGHWDHVDFAGDFNLIPLDRLAKITTLILSGHDHVARTYKHKKTTVQITGSMVPLSHSEDPEGNLYVTKTVAEVLADPDAFKDKCLRILVPRGEDPPAVDCLQLTIKRITDEEEAELEVNFEEGLDIKALFFETMVDVDPEITKEVEYKLDEALHA